MIRVITLIVAATMLLVAAGAALAQAPTTFLYQGRLTDPAGSPITEPVEVTFRIVSGLGDPSILFFTQVETITPDANGVFTVELGPVPANTFTGAKRYLSIKVGDDPEMDPRQPITATPYAMSAEPPPPGIAFSYESATVDLIDGTDTKLDSVEIDCPTAGYVVVTEHCYIQLNHITGTRTIGRFSLSTTGTHAASNFAIECIEGSVASTGFDEGWRSIALTRVETVNPGPHKFYFIGDRAIGATGSSVEVGRRHTTAQFFPTSYGTVDAVTKVAPLSDEGVLRSDQIESHPDDEQ